MLFVFAITIYYCLEVYHFAIYQAIFFSKAFKQHFGVGPRSYREERDKIVYYAKKRENGEA